MLYDRGALFCSILFCSSMNADFLFVLAQFRNNGVDFSQRKFLILPAKNDALLNFDNDRKTKNIESLKYRF